MLVTLCTLLSRVSGFGRVVATAAVLGSGLLGDVYQTANMIPNLLFELVAGGVLRRSDGGLVGDLTKEAIEAFKVDYAIIGTSALDEDGDLLDFDPQEVRVSRAIIRQARQACLVADHSKLERAAPVRIASLSELAMMFTDLPLPKALAEKCAGWGTEVRIAS